MKKLQLLPLAAGGLFVLAAAFPADAQGGNFYSNPDRLIATVMAEDQVDLDETLAVLEPALGEAQDALLQADLSLQQSEIDAAGVLVTFVNAETTARDAQKVFAGVALELATVKDALERIQARPKTQENNAEIAGLEAEIATLRATVEGSKTDLVKAEANLRDARSEVSDSETIIADAETVLDDARNTVEMIRGEINTAQQAFHGEREEVDALVALLSKEQLSALNRSLNNGVASELRVDIDAEHLRTVFVDDYDKQQIAILTEALEAEAKFHQIAIKTGNDRFLAKAAKAKETFLAKIDHIQAEKLDAQRGVNSAFETASGPGSKRAERVEAHIAKDYVTEAYKPKMHDFGRGMLSLHR